MKPQYHSCVIESSKIDQYYRKTLEQKLQLQRWKIDEVRVIGADNLTHLQTWVDMTDVKHTYMNIHTGGYMLFGWGVLH